MSDVIKEVLMCGNGGMSGNGGELAALLNSQNQSNNPMWMLILLALLRDGGLGGNTGGGGHGGGANMAATDVASFTAQLDSLKNQISDNQNSNLVLEGIKGNASAISQLASNIGVQYSALNQAFCDVKAGISKVAGEVNTSAERVINAVNVGDSQVIRAIENCCCSTQKSILEQTNQMNQGFCQNTHATERGFDRLGDTVRDGFCQLGFRQEQDTNRIIQSSKDNTQRLLDDAYQARIQELRDQNEGLRLSASQQAQTATLAGLIRDEVAAAVSTAVRIATSTATTA